MPILSGDRIPVAAISIAALSQRITAACPLLVQALTNAEAELSAPYATPGGLFSRRAVANANAEVRSTKVLP